jgi:REP element-mobilizing transposase RayT
MPYWNCYYHIVWATKHRQPLITPLIEAIILESVRNRAIELACELLAINAVSDHIHVAIRIKPSVSVATWVSQAKGGSSHAVSVTFPTIEPKFQWQTGYRVLTFGEKNLPFVLEYIARQKEHHAKNTFNSFLERIDGED